MNVSGRAPKPGKVVGLGGRGHWVRRHIHALLLWWSGLAAALDFALAFTTKGEYSTILFWGVFMTLCTFIQHNYLRTCTRENHCKLCKPE